MNPKQAVPLVVTLAPLIAAAPPLLIGAAIGLGLLWLFSKDEEAKPDAKPAEAKPESSRTSAESAINTSLVRQLPAEIPIKPVRVPVAAPPLSVPSVPKTLIATPAPVIVPIIKAVIQAPPPPIKRKIVTRQDVAAVFQNGARALSRTAAVDALKRLGFGRTAAYAALSAHGRFAYWLNHAPDGIHYLDGWTHNLKPHGERTNPHISGGIRRKNRFLSCFCDFPRIFSANTDGNCTLVRTHGRLSVIFV